MHPAMTKVFAFGQARCAKGDLGLQTERPLPAPVSWLECRLRPVSGIAIRDAASRFRPNPVTQLSRLTAVEQPVAGAVAAATPTQPSASRTPAPSGNSSRGRLANGAAAARIGYSEASLRMSSNGWTCCRSQRAGLVVCGSNPRHMQIKHLRAASVELGGPEWQHLGYWRRSS